MSSIISKANLEKITNLRKYVLKTAIWVLVGAVIVGAFTILFGGSDSGVIMLKFMGTLFIVALMLMISVNNFRMVTTEIPVVQIFALVGLFSNLLWGALWTLLCWNPEWSNTCSGYSMYSNCEESMLIKFAMAFSYLSFLGFVCSNVMNMYEGEKKNMIRPLKITAVVCVIYEMLYLTVVVFAGYNSIEGELSARLAMLASFVGFAWFFIVIAAFIISRGEKNRAGLEEKVRREMIEKEVREKLEAEQASKE
ncbi:hypothetical protein IKF57_00250 [Candidatus Saccharibacteria bacterium]|nr:hypothetical protein [Candidatus Saccharibacteria bacterium]